MSKGKKPPRRTNAFKQLGLSTKDADTVTVSEANKRSKGTAAKVRRKVQRAKDNMTAARHAARRMAKRAKRVGKKVVKRVGPVGVAYGAYEVSQGRVPVASDVKDVYDMTQDPQFKKDMALIKSAIKEDPSGFAEAVGDEVMDGVKAAISYRSPKEKTRIPKKIHSSFKRGGEVKAPRGRRDKANTCRGGGIAIRGTKFKGTF